MALSSVARQIDREQNPSEWTLLGEVALNAVNESIEGFLASRVHNT